MSSLPHNPQNGVTAGVWRERDVVRKRLTRRRTDAPAHWASSDEPRHWNFWRREALVYETGLPERLGLGAPQLLGITETPEGDVELRLEHVAGRYAGTLTADDVEAAALALGRAQGRPGLLPDAPWLSRRFLRDYSTSRAVRWELLDVDAAWDQPLIREHFSPALRARLLALHHHRDRLLDVMETLPRTVGHLDVWPNNLIVRPNGEVVFVDWAFTGDAAVGEDVGNLIPDSVLDLYVPYALLPELDARLTAAYLAGLREAGFAGDERLVRLGICASAVKYDWLTVFCLQHADAAEHPDYGGAGTVDAHARYASRAAGLDLLSRWAQEALALAAALGR